VVQIGTQVWMAENLNYRAGIKVNLSDSTSWCYGNDAENCEIYGRLYDWMTIMGVDASYENSNYSHSSPYQGICPAEWHIPSDAEWRTLVSFLGERESAAVVLKTVSGWNSTKYVNGNGTNNYGFFAAPSGYRDSDGNYLNIGDYIRWWTTTESTEQAYVAFFTEINSSDMPLGFYGLYKTDGYSLRCIKE
jgi:uncharacterized protein (TIGR02145 family)